MNVLVTSATAQELHIIKSEIRNKRLENTKIDYLICWVGIDATIFSLTQKMTQNQYDLVVNIGVCGAKVPPQHSCVQVARIVRRETDKEALVPVVKALAPLATFLCSEQPTLSFEWYEECDFADMESRWVEYVCQQFKVPRVLLKVPVDCVGEETLKFDRQKALDKLASLDLTLILDLLIKN